MADNGHIVKSFFKQVNDSIENKVNTMTQIQSAIVHSVNLDGTVNITIPPSQTVYHNIQNQSIYRNLMPGDNVKIIKEGNSLSNMWIMGGFGLDATRIGTTSKQTSVQQGDVSQTSTHIESIAKANAAKIKALASWQSQVYKDLEDVSSVVQTVNDHSSSIDLLVTHSGNRKTINSAEIVAAINNSDSSVTINADKIEFSTDDIETRISTLETTIATLLNGDVIINAGNAPRQ